MTRIKDSLGKKKFELLTSPPDDCKKLTESYNGLAETGYISRAAQEIAARLFGFKLQVENEKRHIFVNNGASTAAIRKRYGLNSLLGNDIKKNRQNDKHHALDAICISYSRDFKYNKELDKDVIENFNPEIVRKAIEKIVPYPYTNKKPFKGGTRPLETIYGKRGKGEKTLITGRVELEKIGFDIKKIEKIIDEAIKNDLLSKLENNYSAAEWTEILKNYVHPKKKTKVKKVLMEVSCGNLEKDENQRNRVGEYCDFGTEGAFGRTYGQFKHSKFHKGQMLYYDQKKNVKVIPIYANKSTKDTREELSKMNCKLYLGGQVFYSGCLVEIPLDFKGGTNTYPKGIYKLKTIMAKGPVKLENNNGIEILTSAKNLVDAGFFKYKS